MATSSGGCWSWMAEVAGEELANLEAALPGRFGPLKAELQRLVHEPVLGLDATAFPPTPAVAEHYRLLDASLSPPTATPSFHTAPSLLHLSSTQESSTRKRKSDGGGACEQNDDGKRRRGGATTAAPPGGRKDDRVEMAIARAERCLEKIRAFKRSLLAVWTGEGQPSDDAEGRK